MSTWTKLEPIQGRQQACLHAGIAEELFPPDGVIAVGFGCANLTKGGELVYAEGDTQEDFTGAQAEELALADPDHDWQIHLMSPLSERRYQRHGPGRWVLVQQGDGFA